MPLAGIALAINEKGGHKLVFCYPPEPSPLVVRNSLTLGQSVGAVKPPAITQPAYSPFHEPFGYDAQFLADLLTPRLRVLDRRFLVTVDDLTFIGHPTSLLDAPATGTGLHGYMDSLTGSPCLVLSFLAQQTRKKKSRRRPQPADQYVSRGACFSGLEHVSAARPL